MVEKVVIQPSEVRGLGNIVIPKSVTDFSASDCTVSQSTDTVNGVTTTVYLIELMGFTLSVTQSYVASGNTVTLTVTLLDSDGEPVEDANVDLYKVT